jgi:hypothetical protein
MSEDDEPSLRQAVDVEAVDMSARLTFTAQPQSVHWSASFDPLRPTAIAVPLDRQETLSDTEEGA